MSHTRFSAFDTFINRSSLDYDNDHILNEKISDYYGTNVFGDEEMKKYLAAETYNEAKELIATGGKLSRDLADKMAEGMKVWAIEKGATHYAHWFQPLTGRTAEKHDSFFNQLPSGDIVEEFSGDLLAQQEPDGSSFPGGGLRSTFEARGYTAWDPSSPCFIYEQDYGKTLCIPTIFVTYSGEALDFKLPLLRSCDYLESIAVKVCNLFDSSIKRVYTTLGWEQEYFLVDEALFLSRMDLVLTGRTLVGKHSPKGQQLDDHYFGSIPERVYNYMRDLETECHKLGIPVRTRHNEVGPGQFELAPMFEEANVAVDHNLLLMDVMEKVSRRHKFRVLFHEKPFAGVNGSGKHNNWSMSTDTGKNLLKPGKDPINNIEFLTFFINTIMAVYRYADILRASVASASNDHRLGANEAPPAIISAFLGENLSNMLDALESGQDEKSSYDMAMDLLSKIPDLEKDNTDRNRTSPFAFTGNKFEIRMVGSSMNSAAPMTVMNTIVGRQLNEFYDEVNKRTNEGKSKEEAVMSVLKEYVKASKDIRFEGDGYSEEWAQEAAKRGLPNTPRTPDAIKAYNNEKAKDLFETAGVLNPKELHAHYEVMVENYILKLQIESRSLGEMVINHILPVAIEQQSKLAKNIKVIQEIGMQDIDFNAQKELIREISQLIGDIKTNVNEMTDERRKANSVGGEEAAQLYSTKVKDLMDKIRISSDRLEYIVDDELWPLTKYRELMFIR